MVAFIVDIVLQELRPERSDQSGLRFISGIICKSKVLRFERMLFRATRGNMFFNQAPADEEIVDPISSETVFFLPILFIALRIVVPLDSFIFKMWFCFQFLGLWFLHSRPSLY